VGGGTFRQAYLSPTGVVYKVCRTGSLFNTPNEHNESEYEAYLRIRKAKLKYKGWRINPIHSHTFMDGNERVVVNASKYVEGTIEKLPDGLTEYYDRLSVIDTAFSAFGLSDGHEENYLRTRRGRVIIDMG